MQAKTHQVQPQNEVPLHEETGISEDLRKEIADLKSLMHSMHKKTIQDQYPDELLPFIEYLRQQELSEELITTIGDELLRISEKRQKSIFLNVRWLRKIYCVKS